MKTILAPIDFSSSARNAAAYAAALARAMKTKLILFHSFPVQMPVPGFPDAAISDQGLESKLKKTAQKAAAVLRKRYRVKVDVYVQAGFSPTEEILRMARRLKPSLVIMGMKKQGKIAELLVGSTATSVIRKIKTPVMIIPEKARFVQPKKILLAFDYSVPARPSIFFPLLEIAKIFRSEIYVVNVLKKGEYSYVKATGAYHKLDKSLNGVKHVYHFPKSSDFRNGIDDFLAKHKAVMISTVPHKHNLIERVFAKSNTKSLAFHTHLPLLSLPDGHKHQPTYLV